MFYLKKYSVLVIAILLSGCAVPRYLSGSVNSQVFSTPAGKRIFVVVLPESPTLRDRQIGDQIAERLIQKGYSLALSKEEANTAILYKFSIGQGLTSMSSITSGGQTQIISQIDYPRFFQLTIVDVQATKQAGKPVSIWQGEVYSKGTSTDTPQLAKVFLEVLFENFENSAKEKSFHKLVVW